MCATFIICNSLSRAAHQIVAGSGTGLLRLPLLFVSHLSWRTHGGRRVHNSRHQLCSFFFPRPAQQLIVSTTTTTSGESTRRCERARSPLVSAANTAAKPLAAERGFGVGFGFGYVFIVFDDRQSLF